MITPFNVIVGEDYDVPCVTIDGKLVPVIGPAHVDGKELCQEEPVPPHYHVDWRFYGPDDHPHQVGYRSKDEGFTYQRLKCLREETYNGSFLFIMIRLGRAYQNYRINTTTRICPHNKQMLVNENGKCPGHGLCWNLETGRLKYRYPYYFRFKGEETRFLAEDREVLKIVAPRDLSHPVIVELVDADNQLIGEYLFKDLHFFSKGDTLNIVTGCI